MKNTEKFKTLRSEVYLELSHSIYGVNIGSSFSITNHIKFQSHISLINHLQEYKRLGIANTRKIHRYRLTSVGSMIKEGMNVSIKKLHHS